MNKMFRKRKLHKLVGIVLAAAFMSAAAPLAEAENRPTLAESGARQAWAEEQTDEILRYDPSEFIVTEDYSAFVGPSKMYGNGGNVGRLDPNGEMTMQLDAGMSGLLVSSRETGVAAEGKSVSFANKLKGDFNLDFRVFSQESFYGKCDLSSKDGTIDGNIEHNATVLDDRWNPFLDIRGVGIKITSATDSTKSFTVYLYGGQQWTPLETVARVYIEGESYRESGRKGYGLENGSNAPGGYAYATELTGTSFCNVSGKQKESYYNTIKFDVEKMAVYGTKRTLSGSNRGAYFTETDLLIRNVGTNNLKDDNTGSVYSAGGLKTLESRDFDGGYYVDVIIDDMTSDTTPLKTPTAKEGGDEVYGNAEGKEIAGFESGYARTANLILYNLNGQDFKKYEGFSQEAIDYTYPEHNSVPTGGQTTNGLRLTANATGTAAEGDFFDLHTEDYIQNGVFTVMVGALSKNYAPKAGAEKYSDYFNKGTTGLGKNGIEWDPYSDVRELGVTFRSKTDRSKAFTAYFSSRDTERLAMTARVGIEGESYRDGSGKKGFGGDTNAWGAAHTRAKGTFGMFNNTGSDTYNTQANPYVTLRFDPSAMTVSTYEYGWNTIRTLTSDQAGGGQMNKYVKTLEVADFSGGYDVSLEITSMSPNHNRGLKNVYVLNYQTGASEAVSTNYTATDGNYILAEAYERKAVIDVIGFKDKDDASYNQALTKASVICPENETPFYLETDSWLDLSCSGAVSYSGDIAITPSLVNVLYTSKITDGILFSHESGLHNGTLDVAEGSAAFAPEKLGKYTFTYGEYTQTIDIIDDVPPEIRLLEGLPSLIDLGDTAFSVSEDDVVTADRWGAVKVNIECLYNGRAIDTSDPNFGGLGLYEITYTATDESGNKAKIFRTVAIMADTSAPVIIWNNPPQILTTQSLDLSAIAAIDPEQGKVQVNIEKIILHSQGTDYELSCENNSVTPKDTGELYIYVSAIDSVGNKTEKLYRIEVVNELRKVITADNYVVEEGNEDERGCGSVLGVAGSSIIAVITVLSAAVMAAKRKN